MAELLLPKPKDKLGDHSSYGVEIQRYVFPDQTTCSIFINPEDHEHPYVYCFRPEQIDSTETNNLTYEEPPNRGEEDFSLGLVMGAVLRYAEFYQEHHLVVRARFAI